MICTTCKTSHAPHELRGGICIDCTRKELERVQREAAVMRTAINDSLTEHRKVLGYLNTRIGRGESVYDWRDNTTAIIDSLDVALVTDAGRGYVRLEDVKPLVGALNSLRDKLNPFPSCYSFPAHASEVVCSLERDVRTALAHAREKGLI